MVDEREQSGQKVQVPNEFAWSKLVKLDGDAIKIKTRELQYRHTLENLGKQGDMLGTIFRKAQNKIQGLAKLERLIKMIEKEKWSTLPADVKGEIYVAHCLRKNLNQYFEPGCHLKTQSSKFHW